MHGEKLSGSGMLRGLAMSKERSVAWALMACCLAVLMLPATARPAFSADGGGAAATIERLLASGDYVEGEAIAIVRSDAELQASPQARGLAEVGSDAVEMAVRDALLADGPLGDEVALRVRSIREEAYDVRLVVDHDRTTEEILYSLYDDPDVIAAEPNYIVVAQADADADTALAAQEAKPSPNLGDLTGMQWAMDASLSVAEVANTPFSPTAGYSMNVPGWAEGRTDEAAEPNASGTVCIMDTGFDVDHPDLDGVVYEFSEELQAKYGCGRFGYNASGDAYGTSVLRPSGSHGTHVAGIIAAEWNDQGTSGVANGVKIFCVNVFGGTGNDMEMASVIKGFQFLIDVSQDVNLKAVNCSWGTKQPQFVLTTMVNELGKKGVNTVIAAGNDHENLDETIDFASQPVSSPYVITVDAAMPNGKSSEYSSYGQNSTDVFAPGSAIMSTVPVTVKAESDSGYSRYAYYYPQVTAEQNRIAYERFDGTSAGVRVFDENPAIDAGATELDCPIVDGTGFGDAHSLAIDLGALHKQERDAQALHGIIAENGYVYLAVPVASPQDAERVRWVGVDMAMSDAFKPAGGIDSVTCAGLDAAGPVEVDGAASKALDTGWLASSLYTIYQTQWAPMSYNVDGFVGACNEAHARMLDGEEFSVPTEAGPGVLQDVGEVGGVYAWQPDGADGQAYAIVRLAIGAATNDVQVSDGTTLYVDNVALGDEGAFCGAYHVMSGTSMAAPAVTGCLAVIAAGEEPNSALTDEQLELRARERAAKLLASVDYDDDLATLCRSGGRVNLAANPGFAKKAPFLERASSDGDVLAIEGCFFGDTGSLAIDDVPVATLTWDDGRITAAVSDLANGSHVAKVVNGDGVASRIVFAHSGGVADDAAGDEAGELPLYENTLATLAGVEGFELQDRLWGPMVGLDGCIYAQTASARYLEPQGFWRYDIAADAWTKLDLPQGYGGGSVFASGLAVYRGELYLYGSYTTNGEYSDGTRLWRLDPERDAWETVDIPMPGGEASLVVLDGDLLFIGGTYFGAFGDDAAGICAARADVDAAALEPLSGYDDALAYGMCPQTVTTQGKAYSYTMFDDENGDSQVRFCRLTYDKEHAAIEIEDLTATFKEIAPPLEASAEMRAHKAHVALAGLPDGVAIVGAARNDDGSYVLGCDTHIIYDDSQEAVEFGRASSYHRAFDPLATYCDGSLYVAGNNATEPDAMYFRSTRVG